MSVRPYALTDHIHERESSLHLSSLADSPSPFALSFIPNVAPWFSGIISVLNAPLNKTFRASDISQLYAEKYENERLCLVQKGVVDVRDAEGKHGWRVGGIQVHSGGQRVVVTVSILPSRQMSSISQVTNIVGRARQFAQGSCYSMYAGELSLPIFPETKPPLTDRT
jgi:hypothetical protein